jgi:hypothetical protein
MYNHPQKGTLGFSVKLEGDWDLATKSLLSLNGKLRRASANAQRNFARRLYRRILSKIMSQDFEWVPYTEKKYKSQSDIHLVNSLAYYNAIEIWRQDNTYYVGVRRGQKNAKGQEIADYAYVLEYGRFSVKYQQPRPHWTPTVIELGGSGQLKRETEEAIYKQLQKMQAAGFKVNYGN